MKPASAGKLVPTGGVPEPAEGRGAPAAKPALLVTRGALHLGIAGLLATAVLLLVAGGQRQNDLEDLQQLRAVRIARAVAYEAARDDNAATQAAVAALPEAVSGVQSVLVLKGTQIAVHSDAAQAGRSLDRESDADKALFDRAARLRATVSKNDDERTRNPQLDRDAYAEVEAFWRKDAARLVTSVPVVRDGAFKGMVVLETSPVGVPAPIPWSLLVAFVVLVLVGVPVAQRLSGAQLLGAGAALLVVLLVADTLLLARWRGALRHEVVAEQASTAAALANAGLAGQGAGPAGPEDGPAGLAHELAQDVFHRPTNDLVALRLASAPPTPGTVAYASGAWAADVSEAFFAEGRTADLRALWQWALGIGLVTLLGFVLGALGRLRRGFDALVEHRWAYAYLAPAMVGMVVLVFVPVAVGIVLGFTERRYNVFEFAGLANYVAILSDFDVTHADNFYFTFGVTVMWTVLNVLAHVGIGLFLALLLNDQMLKARGLYRVILIIPWAIPNYITALIWRGLFHKQFGAVNAFLGLLGIEPVSWFQSFWPAFTTNVVTNTWLGFPFMMVVSLGALQSIPPDLYEAAWVDGANRWQRFRFVTIPLLMPALVPAVINGVVWTFNMFNIIYLVSGGAPDGKTDILITEAFRWAFERDKYGYAAAYSTLIFLILLSFTLVTNRITGATKGAFE